MPDYTDWTTQELEEEFQEVIASIADIKSKIADYIRRCNENPASISDKARTWYVRAKAARRYLGAEHQEIQSELGKRRKEAGLQASQKRSAIFYQVVKEVVPDSTWETIRLTFHQRLFDAGLKKTRPVSPTQSPTHSVGIR